MASKLKGKEWFQIYVPKMFGDIVIGETMAIDPQNIMGRVVEASMTDISGDPSKYYLKFFFKVNEIKDGKAQTTLRGHDCTRDYISRIVRTRTTRIDTNEIVDLTDVKLRVKTISISNRAVSNNIASALRKGLQELVKSELSKMSYEQFMQGMIEGSIQSRIRKSISKVYPLRQFEFRKTEVQ
jgi:small subunit ribosomal protein S3Ae